MLISNLSNDLRYTLRQFRRSPGFTITAVLTLALGIGAATTMFSIVRSSLLAPLPYPAQQELVGVALSTAGSEANNEQTGESADFLLSHATSFSSAGVADDGSLGQNFSIGDNHPRAIRSLRVSVDYLPTLGVAPLLGRTFTSREDLPGAAPVAVLSEGLWRSSLNADPNVVGRSVHINADPYTVIGVMPGSFTTLDSPDLWQPLHLSPSDSGYRGDNFQFIGRLKSGITFMHAVAELGPLSAAFLRQFPNYLHWGPPGTPPMHENLWPLQAVYVSSARSSLRPLAFAILAVLLVASLNLAGLVMARSAVRRQEIAVRSALGAGQGSVLRLLLTESLVLAFSGSILGLGLARLALPILLASSPLDLPQLRSAGIDPLAALFTLLLGGATMLLFGLLPALGVFRTSTSSSLGGARTAGAAASQQRLGRILVVAQVGLATMLLSAGALLLGTFLKLRSVPSGVRPENLSLLQVDLKGTAYHSSAHTQQFIAAVEDRLRSIPGVDQVATVNGIPLDRGLNNGGYPAGRKELAGLVQTRFVTPGYFRTAGTELLAGADISASDTAKSQPVALINQQAAKLWWPGRAPVGEYVVDGGAAPRRIIGIVADARDRTLADKVYPTVYLPYTQASDDTIKTINGWFPTTFLLRTPEVRSHAADQTAIAAAATAAVAAADPEVSVARFAPMQSLIDHSIAAPRFFSWLAGAFSGFALLLTVIGIFGLLSYQVASRTREMGVRMTLGATRANILNLVLWKGLGLTAIGLLLGVLGSIAVRGVLTALIADTARVDAMAARFIIASQTASIAIAASAMLLCAAVASLIPARRAASIEPTEALRAE